MFNGLVQVSMAYVLILTVGVLHGANDINIIRYAASNKGLKIRFSRVLAYYIATVLAILAIFAVYPTLALIMFIVISGYHFGEQHLKACVKKQSGLMRLLYLSYGLTILFMVFFLNLNKVISIFMDLTPFYYTSAFFGYLLISAASLMVIMAGLGQRMGILRVNIIKELFYFAVLYVLFNTADLLWGFAIYFILWHSLPSLKDQIIFLYGKANKEGLVQYLKSSWLYWGMSLFGLLVLFLVFRNNTEFLTSILIYFLAAITFPHVIVMSRLEQH
jgi:Brp/Blh family beta-carotene 15,15'-monooxygenase